MYETLDYDFQLILRMRDLDQLKRNFLHQFVSSMVVVSKNTIIIRLNPTTSRNEFEVAILQYNVEHPEYAPFQELSTFQGERIFRAGSRQSHRHVAASNRPRGAPDPSLQEVVATFRGAPMHSFVSLVDNFLAGCKDAMRRNDPDLPDFTMTAHPFMDRGQLTGKVLVTCPQLEAMRIWYLDYHDFQWHSDDGRQTIEIRLSNEMFERELQSSRIRLLAAGQQLPYQLSMLITRDGDLPAGHLKPGRNVRQQQP